jgi:hypothetical protein
MESRDSKAADFLTDCGECGSITLAATGGPTPPDVAEAQRRFDQWAERAMPIGRYAALAVAALRPVFLASEVADERRDFLSAVARASELLANLHDPEGGELPDDATPGWYRAAERDLGSLKKKDVPDDDPRVVRILDDVNASTLGFYEVATEYRFRRRDQHS